MIQVRGAEHLLLAGHHTGLDAVLEVVQHRCGDLRRRTKSCRSVIGNSSTGTATSPGQVIKAVRLWLTPRPSP